MDCKTGKEQAEPPKKGPQNRVIALFSFFIYNN